MQGIILISSSDIRQTAYVLRKDTKKDGGVDCAASCLAVSNL